MWTVRPLSSAERLELIAAALVMAPVPAVFVGGREIHAWIDIAAQHLPSTTLWFGFGLTVPVSLALLLGVLCRRVHGSGARGTMVGSYIFLSLMWASAMTVPAAAAGILAGVMAGLAWLWINLRHRATSPPGAFPVQLRPPAQPLANVADAATPTEKN